MIEYRKKEAWCQEKLISSMNEVGFSIPPTGEQMIFVVSAVEMAKGTSHFFLLAKRIQDAPRSSDHCLSYATSIKVFIPRSSDAFSDRNRRARTDRGKLGE
jgi:hypothetical protein